MYPWDGEAGFYKSNAPLVCVILSLPNVWTDKSNIVFSLDGQRVQNIQPFTKRDLDIRSLGDRIRDINEITHLYPNFSKHEVFKKFYSGKEWYAPNLTYGF